VRPLVDAALADGQLGARAAEQLCAVLDKVPAQVEQELLAGVLLDGVGGLLQTDTGGLVPDDAVTADLLTARAAAQAVLQACVADTTAGPAQRLEPALVLLAGQLAPSHLGPALRQLLEALLPDGSDGVDRDPYFFELRELLDGDVDVRGHLTPEVGHGLAAEIARRVAQDNASSRRPISDAAPAEDAAPPQMCCGPGRRTDNAARMTDAPAARTTSRRNDDRAGRAAQTAPPSPTRMDAWEPAFAASRTAPTGH
jgi:hypothetical protein